MSRMADLEVAINDFREGRTLDHGQAELLGLHMQELGRQARINAMYEALRARRGL